MAKRPPERGSFRAFCLILTERCNWRCGYCYQPRGSKSLKIEILDAALTAVSPFLTASPVIQFYGGEPLLAFGLIRRAVGRAEEIGRDSRKHFRYALTTNGSLLDRDVLSFLNEHRFTLALSFDGLAQEQGRRPGSFALLTSLLETLPRYPEIAFSVNSVFGPRTAYRLSASVAWLAGRGVRDIDLAFDTTVPWTESALNRLVRELRVVRSYLLDCFRTPRSIPLANFRRPPARGVFSCTAGRDRLALDPQGRLWGCYVYFDFFRAHPSPAAFRRFCFGTVADFIRSGGVLRPETLDAYSSGRMDFSETTERACGVCRTLDRCAVCPPAAALGSGRIGRVPVALCRINRILIEERERFWKQAGFSGP